MGKLEGKVAAITGGTRSIGRAMADAFLAEGASVVVNGRSEEKGQRCLDEMNAGDRAAFFAGDATDGRALAAAETMLADLELAIAGATTAADVANAVEAWFDTPGTGFDTIGYLGSDTGLAPFRLGGGERADFSARADDPALRETMKGFAMAALLEGNAFTGTITERLELSRTAAVKLLNAQDRVTDLQATIGNAEASIARAEVRSGTERAALEIARGGLIGADPFEAATRLETAQTQLETLFALTARVSRMTLVDFLR